MNTGSNDGTEAGADAPAEGGQTGTGAEAGDAADPAAPRAEGQEPAAEPEAALEPQEEAEPAAPAITRRGWNRGEGGEWYWSDDGRTAATGWVRAGGKWYYLDPETYVMRESEAFEVSGKTYVAGASGACPASSWVRAGGKWYLTDSSCAARSGWAKVSGAWYYLDPETRQMRESEAFEVSGKTYVARASGACPASSWVRAGGKWYLTDSSCAARSGWAKVSGAWYYLDPETRQMREGEAFEVRGRTYVARASGACPASSWVMAGGKWYLTDSSCAARGGWAKVRGKWYWLDPETRQMATGFVQVKGATYHLSSPNGDMSHDRWLDLGGGAAGWACGSGEVTAVEGATISGGRVTLSGRPGWNQVGPDRFHVSSDGSLTSGWLEDGGKWYWLDPSTHMAARSCARTVEGVAQVFGADGAWVDITGDSALNHRIAAIMRDTTGLDLRACYDYVWRSYSYRSMGYWPSWSGWQRDYAREMLDRGSGNCYAYASLFQYMAKACGYDTKLIKGWAIGMGSGKHTPHGWVECYINGQTYVIDPEISYESHAGDFYMFKYSDCPHMDGVYYAYGSAGDTNLTILK